MTPRPPTRRSRPTGPRCRGGASSVLRLAAANTGTGPSSWFGALAALRPMAPRAGSDERQAVLDISIITRLLPSHELVGR